MMIYDDLSITQFESLAASAAPNNREQLYKNLLTTDRIRNANASPRVLRLVKVGLSVPDNVSKALEHWNDPTPFHQPRPRPTR